MMKRSLQIPLLVAAAWLALCLSAGCNAVLGIEEAQPRGTAGGTGNGSAGSAGSSASTPGTGLAYTGTDSCKGEPAANTACQACLTQQCTSAAQSLCTKDHSCRRQMDDYDACLGASCLTPNQCFEQTLLKPGQQVNDCYSQCADACAVSPIYSPCDLYCACMGANCSDQFSDTPMNGQFGSLSDCLTKCQALPPEIVTCRRTHCELAGLSADLTHCDHAVGHIFCSSTMPTDRTQCTDKSLDSFACQQSSECCSGNCNALHCVRH
jgi:hypothetical protein